MLGQPWLLQREYTTGLGSLSPPTITTPSDAMLTILLASFVWWRRGLRPGSVSGGKEERYRSPHYRDAIAAAQDGALPAKRDAQPNAGCQSEARSVASPMSRAALSRQGPGFTTFALSDAFVMESAQRT